MFKSEKMKLHLCLFLFMSVSSAIVFDVPVKGINYSIIKEQGYDRIVVRNSISIDNPGAPEIPALAYTYCLPSSQGLKNISVISETWAEIPGEFYLYPQQQARSIEEAIQFTPPDQGLYSSESFYPEAVIINHARGNLRGYGIAQFAVAPFRYYPLNKKLEVLTGFKIEFETEPVEHGITPLRQSSRSQAVFKEFVSSIALNHVEPLPLTRIEDNPYDLSPTDLPSLLGPPVDLVIITNDAQVPAYEKLSRFKKLFGFNTVVKTMAWVNQNYPGIDDAERLRNFIKDAVEKWGVSYVLLGGDVPDVPTRIVWFAPLMGQWPMHIATDLYFSDLDNEFTGQGINWNFDGDDKFGETEDSIDFYPDVFVGRLPTKYDTQVVNYLEKISVYLFPPVSPHKPPSQIKALFVSSDFYSANDAYNMATRLNTHLPPWYYSTYLNEKPLQSFKNGIYQGYNLITILCHGDVNLARIRTSPRENATNFFFDSLTNPTYPLLVIISCYTGPFQVDCLGEHWVVGESGGGGIGYIGPTSSSSAYDHEAYTQPLFDYIFADSLGHPDLGPAQAFAKIPLISSSQWYNWKRVFQFGINLLGDPALPIWDSIPKHFESVLLSPDTLDVGIDTVTISLTPGADFSVVFYKENEVFLTDSGYNGFLQVPVKTTSSGYLKYNIVNREYRFFIDSVYVKPANPLLTYNSSRVVDSLHNTDGIINPGEDIFLYVNLANNGGNIAQNVGARIFCADSFIVMLTDSAGYPDVMPGQTGENTTPYHFKTTNSIPDEHWLNLRLAVSYSGSTSEDTFQVAVSAPEIKLFTQQYTLAADTLRILPFIENQGSAPADSVTALITAYSDTLVVLDSIVDFPVIQPGDIVSSQPDSFRAYLAAPGRLEYYLKIYFRSAEVIGQTITLATPPALDSIWLQGGRNSIYVKWLPVAGAIGYRIFRATDYSGPYEFLNNQLIPISRVEDYDVQNRTDYFYYVITVDSSLNESMSSDTVCGQTNPPLAPGWPATIYGYLFSSPNFGNIDPDVAGLEVVVGCKDGAIYAWHCDGTPIAGDGRLFQTTGEIWSSPAIGDLDQNGSYEIAFGVRTGANNIYVIDNQGNPLPNWPKSLSGGVISSPVFADIDNDGDLEIFVCSEWGGLYAFHHTGEGVYAPSGLLKNLYGWMGGTPAIADINLDNDLEIVVAGGSETDSLFVFSHNGTNLPPFPIPVMRCMSYSIVLGDIIGDGKFEICFYTDSSDCVHMIDANGNYLWQKPIMWLGDVEAGPVIADINGDDHPEVICGNNAGTLMVFDSLGIEPPGFPPYEEHNFKLPIVIDVDGNSQMDIITGSTDWYLYANSNTGEPLPEFPIGLGNEIHGSPAAYDIDGDSKLELMAGDNGFKFYVFELNGIYFEWPRFRYDQYNTGAYQSGNLAIKGQKAYPDFENQAFSLKFSPNPFYRTLDIRYQIADNGKKHITLKIYDATGRLVIDLTPRLSVIPSYITHSGVGGNRSSIVWTGTDQKGRKVPAGVYFLHLESDDRIISKKAILLR